MSPHAFESLEPRQLLTLTTVGSDGLVPGPSNIAFQDMAVSTGGDSIVATVEEAAKPKLTAIRYDSTGQQVGSPITLATPDNPFFEQNVAVSMDPAGDAVVAYAQNNDEVDAILISKDGQVGSPKVVDTSTGNEGSVFTLDVSMDSSGGFFAGWILNNGDTSTLHFRAFDSTGAAKAAAFQLPGNSSTGSYDDVSVASFADGSGAIFAHEEQGEDGNSSIRYGQISTTALVGNFHFQSPHFSIGDIKPEIALYPDHSFVIGFESVDSRTIQLRDPVDFGGFVQRYDSSLNPVGSEIELGATLPGVGAQKHIESISVDTTADGGFVAAFAQTVHGTGAVYASKFEPDDAEDPTGPAKIADVFSRATAIGADNNGNVVVTHLNASDDVDNTSGEVHIQRLSIQSIFVKKRELFVLGTNAADNIDVSFDGANVIVTEGGAQKFVIAFSKLMQMTINGYDGNDTITNETALPSTIKGGNGNDVLIGGSHFDVINGNDGNDSISGGDGNDKLFGDGGLDSLSGNAGRDSLFGGAGNDRLGGNGGRDKLFGGEGDDRLFGGASGDWLFGEGGRDQVNGEGGDDRLYGDGFGTDTVSDPGIDTLHGNAGDDQFFTAGDGFNDQLFGDGGHDSADADQTDVLTSIETSST